MTGNLHLAKYARCLRCPREKNVDQQVICENADKEDEEAQSRNASEVEDHNKIYEKMQFTFTGESSKQANGGGKQMEIAFSNVIPVSNPVSNHIPPSGEMISLKALLYKPQAPVSVLERMASPNS